ncbi:MAG: DUF1524 domain-containing protein [Burkholderiales bacterium]
MAADLIKNFIFQRLLERGTDVEAAYQLALEGLRDRILEKEVLVSGGFAIRASSIFLNHWLIARTGEEVVAREVFDRFKRYADDDAGLPMAKLVEQVHRAAEVYRQFIPDPSSLTGSIDRLGLFVYRTGVLESEVIKPMVLYLLDLEQPAIPEAQFVKALDVVESWMVRRMLVRATTKSYSQIVAELVAVLRRSDRARAGDVVESFFANQSSGSRYWPDDAEIREELAGLLAYRRLGRGRLRMVLEAIEDHRRGWKDGKAGLGAERVARGNLAIEHVMPRKWHSYWPLDGHEEAERDRGIHTLGNLTLLTKKLNSKQSNGPWLGAGGKREGLEQHDVLILNRELLKRAGDKWTDDAIHTRTRDLIEIIVEVWPVPVGHKSGFSPESKPRLRKKVQLADLINGGVLAPGMTLFPARKKYSDRVATLLPDGYVDVDGVAYASPSDAASAIAGKRTGGWWFFLTDQANRTSLRKIRRDYVNAMVVDAEDDEPDEDDDDERDQ